jgi:hypothetical protein
MSGVLSSFALPYLLWPESAPTCQVSTHSGQSRAAQTPARVRAMRRMRPCKRTPSHQQVRRLAGHAAGHAPAVALNQRIRLLPSGARMRVSVV